MAHVLQTAAALLAVALAWAAAWPDRRRFGLKVWLCVPALVAALIVAALGPPTLDVLAVAVAAAVLAWINPDPIRRALVAAVFAVAVLAIYRLAIEAIPSAWLLADAIGAWLGRIAGRLAGSPLWVGNSFGGVDFLVTMLAFWGLWLATCPVGLGARRTSASGPGAPGGEAPARRDGGPTPSSGLLPTEPPGSSGLPGPRGAIAALGAIILAQFAYLVVLADSSRLLDFFAAVPIPPMDESSDRTQPWILTNALRSLIPWNLPILAAVFHGLVAWAMVRWAPWRVSGDAEQVAAGLKSTGQPPSPAATAAWGVLGHAGWIGAVALALAAFGFWRPSSLDGKTVLLDQQGYYDPSVPEHGRPDQPGERLLGPLAPFVESLGGRLVTSSALGEDELAGADLVILVHPDRPWPADRLERLRDYVRRGGALVVLAEPRVVDGASLSSFAEVLDVVAPSIVVRRDTAIPLTEIWEESFVPLAHPATLGVGPRAARFGFSLGSSLALGRGANPMLVGRWGWSEPGSDAVLTGAAEYRPGQRLGDLVLAAEQSAGQGAVVVLGDVLPLTADGNVAAFPFTGRLLAHLAGGRGPAWPWWRQAVALLAAVVVLASLMAVRRQAHTISTLGALALAALAIQTVAAHAGRVLPDGKRLTSAGAPTSADAAARLETTSSRDAESADVRRFRGVAYIDGTHLEAMSDDPWSSYGLGAFQRMLMRNGWLPLLAPDLSAERLDKAGLLVLIAPAKQFSGAERAAIRDFLTAGGTLVAMAGAAEAGPINELLADQHLGVPTSPLSGRINRREPRPLGASRSRYLVLEDKQGEYETHMQFFAAWPVEAGSSDAEVLKRDQDEVPVIVRQPVGAGQVVLVGDTYFAVNENLLSSGNQPSENEVFWRWLLGRVGAAPEWIPPRQPVAPDRPEAQDDRRPEQPDRQDAREGRAREQPSGPGGELPFDENDLMEPEESEPTEGAAP